MKWARSQDPPCPWDERTAEAAAREGHLEVLKFLVDAGCPWDLKACKREAKFWHNNHGHIVSWILSQSGGSESYTDSDTDWED